MHTQKMDTNVGIEFYVQKMIFEIEKGRNFLITTLTHQVDIARSRQRR